MKCCLDLDGVIVDFIKGASKVHKIDNPYYPMTDSSPKGKDGWDVSKTFNMSLKQFYTPMEEEFWSNLEFTPEAEGLLYFLEGLFGDKICLLTAPSMNKGCIPGKIKWINKNLPKFSKRFLIGTSKEFCAGPNTLLIDDNDDNVEKFMNSGGNAFLFPRPWNSNYTFAMMHENPFYMRWLCDSIRLKIDKV